MAFWPVLFVVQIAHNTGKPSEEDKLLDLS